MTPSRRIVSFRILRVESYRVVRLLHRAALLPSSTSSMFYARGAEMMDLAIRDVILFENVHISKTTSSAYQQFMT